jgi:predicted small secreted protein
MQLKPITAIAVLLLVVASLLVTGCINNTTNNQASDITKYPTTGHSALLSAIVDRDNESRNWESYNVNWYNNTVVKVHGTVHFTDRIMTEDNVYTQFPTVEAANKSFDSLRPQYPVKSKYTVQEIYSVLVTGKTPSVFKSAESTDGDSYLLQEDTVICQRTFTHTNINQA